MNDLFRDQLLKAGLATKKQAKAVAHEENVSRRKRRRKKAGEGPEESVDAAAARAAAEEKAARDKALNEEREAARASRARIAEVDDIISKSRCTSGKGDIGYKFVDGKRVKTLHVDSDMQRDLADGAVGIVRMGEEYWLVPRETAIRVEERCPERLVLLNDPEASDDDFDDEFKVPDNLMW